MSKSSGKKEAVDMIFDKFGFKKKECGEVYDAIFEHIKSELMKGREVCTPLGAFSLKHVDDATKRNPRTGEPVDVKAHYKPVFDIYPSLKEAVKNYKPE